MRTYVGICIPPFSTNMKMEICYPMTIVSIWQSCILMRPPFRRNSTFLESSGDVPKSVTPSQQPTGQQKRSQLKCPTHFVAYKLLLLSQISAACYHIEREREREREREGERERGEGKEIERGGGRERKREK
jgi:hypothetical protein